MTRAARKFACLIGGATALTFFRAALAWGRRKQLTGKVVEITGAALGVWEREIFTVVCVPHLLSYSCAKAAAVNLSNGLRSEVRQFQIATVIPGLMRTARAVSCVRVLPAVDASNFNSVRAGN
jgi:NAD(P)-dependent dehydrogenase (short-subunit alcohol dehydrogenase family)